MTAALLHQRGRIQRVPTPSPPKLVDQFELPLQGNLRLCHTRASRTISRGRFAYQKGV